jgi:hypothetical protein
MLVLGDLAELPLPGDEAAAIAFVSAMVERALLPPVGQPSTSIIQESDSPCPLRVREFAERQEARQCHFDW